MAEHCHTCGAELPTPGALCARCGPTAVSRPRHPVPPPVAAENLSQTGERTETGPVQGAAPAGTGQTTATGAEPGQALLEEGDIKVGDLLEGKWRVERQLGAGGMGTVFSAHDLALDRKVAIKVLNADLCRDQEFVARFEFEARATAKLEHPNVVPVHSVGRHQGRPFMVMKQLEGETLAWHLEKDGRLTPARTLELMRQICAGLGHLHANGCVHRDIKAGNVFISPAGVATILDFGVLHDRSAPGITQVGSIVGTPRYMSPEQAKGAVKVDLRADIYALGVLLFECLTGQPPFDSATAQAVIRMHAEVPPPDITSVKKDLPPAMVPFIRKALAKNPEERFPSTEAFISALEAALIDPQHFDPSMVASLPAQAGGAQYMVSVGSRYLGWLLALLVVSAGGAVWQYRAPLSAMIDQARGIAPPPGGADPGEPKPPPPVERPPTPKPPEPKRPIEVRRPVAPPPSSSGKGLVGTLKIVTVLSGGKIYPANVTVDGIDRGKSPVTLPDLPASGHVVKVERPGFQTSEQTVFVPAGGVKVLRVELVP